MIYLLDTHIILRLIVNPELLSTSAKEIVSISANTCFVSVVSFWEISIKYSLGKLDLNGFAPLDIPMLCKEMGFESIAMTEKDSSTYNQLTATYHKDPFDRMLIWQAIQNNYTLVSDDSEIKKYVSEGLKLVW